MMLMILGNTVVLAWDHHPMEESTYLLLELLNFIFSMIFIIELLLKLPGLGWREYKRDAFNIFDALIVLAGVVELALAPPSFIQESSGGAGAISAFRVFRVGRIFKLARSWTQLQNVLVVIVNTLAAAGCVNGYVYDEPTLYWTRVTLGNVFILLIRFLRLFLFTITSGTSPCCSSCSCSSLR